MEEEILEASAFLLFVEPGADVVFFIEYVLLECLFLIVSNQLVPSLFINEVYKFAYCKAKFQNLRDVYS